MELVKLLDTVFQEGFSHPVWNDLTWVGGTAYLITPSEGHNSVELPSLGLRIASS